MKTSFKVLIYVSLLVFLPSFGTAQEKEASNSDLLRVKIEQFEKTDLTSKSATVRSIYQRTLLRLYTQFDAALKQDIADLKSMQAVVGETAPESKEIASQLQKLSVEQSVTIEKIRTITSDASATVPQEPSAPEQVSKLVRNPAVARPSDPNTDVPRTLKGRVTVINEQIFTNAYKFTPDQVRRAVQKVISGRLGIAQQTDDKEVPDIEMEGTKEIVKAQSVPRNPPPPLQGNLILKKDHVGALNTPLAEVKVKVEGNGIAPQEFLTDYQGNFTTSALGAGSYVFSVKVGDYKTSIPVNITAGVATPPPNLQVLIRPLGEFCWFEQAGASAAKSDQKYFFDLTLSHPLPFQKSVDPYLVRGVACGEPRE